MKILRAKLALPRLRFLEKIDRYLLVNFPRLWGSRIHHILFYSFLANIFTGLFIFTLFRPKLNFESISYLPDYNLSDLIWLIIIPEAIVFIIWFYTQSLFNVEGEYGNTHYTIGFLEIAIFLICSFLIFSPSMTALVVGIKKTAYTFGVNQQTICNGPFIMKLYPANFLDQPGYDTNNIRKALEMSEKAILSGKAKEDRIWIETAVIRPEELEVTISVEGNSIAVQNRSRIIIEDGEAEVTLGDYQYPVTIKTAGVIKTVQADELTILRRGDEIINYLDIPLFTNPENPQEYYDYIYEHTPVIFLTKGTLTTRTFSEIILEEGDAIIREKGQELILVEGEATAETDREISDFFNDSVFETCLQLKYFHAKEPPDNVFYFDTLGYDTLVGWHVFFVILGTFLLITLKHGGWLNVAYFIIYWLLQILVIALFFDSLLGDDSFGLAHKLGIFPRTPWTYLSELGYSDSDTIKIIAIIMIISLALFVLVQFIRLSKVYKAKTYKRIMLWRLVSLPIEASLVLLITIIYVFLVFDPDENIGNSIIYASLLFVNIALISLQKRMLIYLMSLPKG